MAVKYLKGYKRPDKVISIGSCLRFKSQGQPDHEQLAAAASDADSALIVSGAVPYTLAEVSKPRLLMQVIKQ